MLPAVIFTFAITLGFILPGLFVPWVMRRRAASPPISPGSGSPWPRIGLALLCVPLMVQLLMLLLMLAARLTGTNPAPSGPQFFLGFPESIILAVLGGLGLLRLRQRANTPTAPKTHGRHLVGVGLICFGMFLGGLKINEAQRDHFQRVQNLNWEVTRLQPQWHAAQQAVFEAQSQLTQLEVNAPSSPTATTAERQRFAAERARLQDEVTKAKAHSHYVNNQIQAVHDTVKAQHFPTLADFQFVAAWSLPFVLAGLVVLYWRRPRPAANADSPASATAAPREHPATWVLLGMFLLTLLAGALFFKAARSDLFAPPSRVAITNVQHAVMGESNTVFFAELDLRVEGSEAVEFLVEFTGPALSSDAAERTSRESADHGRLFASLATGANNALLLTPTPAPAVPATRVFAPGSHKWQVGFAFPTATLAAEARGGFVAPVSIFTPPPRVNARPGMEKIFVLFIIGGPNHTTYQARLVARQRGPAAPPLSAANPEWVSVSAQSQHNETFVKLNWEILASQPGTAQFYREGNSSVATLQRDSKSKLHRTTASMELTRLSTNSYRLVSKKGYATITEHFTGNFRELADELLRSKNLSAKTVRGTPIELCRVRGHPFTVTVVASPPPPETTRQSTGASYGIGTTRGLSVWGMGLIAMGAVVIGFGGVALLVWLLRKSGASKRTVLLVLSVPLVLFALALAALVGMYGIRRDFGSGVGLARLEKAGPMVLESNYPAPAQPHPPGRVQQTQNGFRLQLPPAQLACFELFIRQADDSWQAVPSLTALVATSTNASYHDTLYWTLRRSGEPETTNQLWFWTVSANNGSGHPLPHLTDHGTNFTHAVAPGESLDWWQLAATPTQTVLKPGEQQIIPLFRTHGTATTDGKHPKEAFLRVRCEPLPASLNIMPYQQLVDAGLAAHARLAKVLPATNAATTIPPHIEFKVLRVENPPGTRNILLHFERDTNAALSLEVWQDVTPSPGLHKQPRPGTYLDSQMRTWVGVNHDRVLRWTLPNEFTEAEVRAVVKDIEQRAKVWRALDAGHVMGFATVTHRDGWKYHLVATVKRTPGLPSSPSTDSPVAAPVSSNSTAISPATGPKSSTGPIPSERLHQATPNASVKGRLLDDQGKPLAHHRLLVINPIMEATHQQPQIFAEIRTGDDGGFSAALPVAKPFVVVLPRNRSDNGPGLKDNESNAGLSSPQQLIGDRGGPMGQPPKLLAGVMEVRVEGEKLKVHFRELREVFANVESAHRPGAQASDVAQQRLRAIALESVAQAVRTGELYILHEASKTPPAHTHDPETGYPILALPVGDPEASKLFNEAMRAYFRDQKSAKGESK